jgi:hypothetical protein
VPRKLRIQYPGAIYHVMNREGLLPKGHPVKVQLARQLRQETTMSLKWIAGRLHMGAWTYVSNLLAEPPKPPTLCQNTLPLFP